MGGLCIGRTSTAAHNFACPVDNKSVELLATPSPEVLDRQGILTGISPFLVQIYGSAARPKRWDAKTDAATTALGRVTAKIGPLPVGQWDPL